MKKQHPHILRPFSCFILSTCLLGALQGHASILLLEDFETDGEGIRYTSTTSFTDGVGDYFIRTDGFTEASDIPAYSGFGGSYFWAAEDVDASDNPTGLGLLDFTGLSITGIDQIALSLDIGAGSFTTFDAADDFVHVQYRIDGGVWQTALSFQNDGTVFNSSLHQDTDFDGIGDGVRLEFALQNISTGAISVTGSTMDLRLDTFMTGGGEAVAFDNIQVVAVPEPALTIAAFASIILLLVIRKRFLPRRENESRA